MIFNFKFFYFVLFVFVLASCSFQTEHMSYSDALQETDKVIKRKPYVASNYIIRARLKVDIGDAKGAIDDFNKAIELENDNYIYYVSRARGREKLLLKNLIDISEYDLALKDADKAISLKPDKYDGYYVRAILKAYVKKDFEGALQDYNKVIELKDDVAKLYNERAFIYSELGDYLNASVDLQKAIDLDDNEVAYYYNMIPVMVYLKYYDKALAYAYKVKSIGFDDSHISNAIYLLELIIQDVNNNSNNIDKLLKIIKDDFNYEYKILTDN